jgi:WD40 repeat protein
VEITWDPQHPFRLASGGDDGTVRLWDVRKAGSAACLGVLDRENGPGSDVTRNDNNGVDAFKKAMSAGDIILASRKRCQKTIYLCTMLIIGSLCFTLIS